MPRKNEGIIVTGGSFTANAVTVGANSQQIYDASHNQNDSSTTHNTTIGEVTGQVHTGSGHINVDQFLAQGQEIQSQETFLTTLQALEQEIRTTGLLFLTEDMVDDMLVELNAAAYEAHKPAAKGERIISRLEKIQSILSQATDSASTVIAHKAMLLTFSQLTQTLIQTARQLF
ncbi:MAG: hypothetical protein KA314_25805 [Chloroflexi bacterium]|nr:hypothetical protein [Chloroflexota bacterium]MBP8059265.1 hypothetical protein [Chloroflexota bacterium]